MKYLKSWTLRFCISAALLCVIFWFLPIESVWSSIARVPPSVWLFTLVVFVLAHAVAAMKWWLLAAQKGTPLIPFVRAHFIGLMGNLCLPGVAGGDIVRGAWVMRQVGGKMRIGVACVADRIVDTFVSLILASLGAYWIVEGDDVANGILLTVATFLSLALAGGLVVCFGLWWWRPSDGFLGKVVEALDELIRRPSVLLQAFVLSLLIQSTFVLLNFQLGKYTGADTYLAVWFLTWPLAKLIALVPLTLAGLGIRESSLILLMQPFGPNPPAIAAAGLVWQSILFAGGLVGGLTAMNYQSMTKEEARSL